jgi:dihydroorotate dehydrogenase electron transfer subunit
MKSTAVKHQEIVDVIWNKQETPDYYRIGLTCSKIYANALPGQFITLHIPGNLTPLLRRPFSIHRLIKTNGSVTGIEILYKVVGGFTEKLARLTAGSQLDLLGPIGKGFTISDTTRKAAFVAGGIGVAPLVFLADAMAETGMNLSDSIVCLGGRTSVDILCAHVFTSFELNIFTTTDDGSLGEKGLVTQLLEKWLASNRPDIIYACGPMPMLRAVTDIAKKNSLPCEVSIETIMACGLGACLGCAVNKNEKTDTYQHVCIDGPVFDASELTF